MLGFFILIVVAFVLFMIVSGWFGVGAFIAHASRRTGSSSTSSTSSTSSSDTGDSDSSTSPGLFDNKPSEAEIQHQVAHHGLDAHGEALVRHHGMDGHTAALHSGSTNDPHDPTKGGGGFGGGIGGI